MKEFKKYEIKKSKMFMNILADTIILVASIQLRPTLSTYVGFAGDISRTSFFSFAILFRTFFLVERNSLFAKFHGILRYKFHGKSFLKIIIVIFSNNLKKRENITFGCASTHTNTSITRFNKLILNIFI